MGLMSVSLQELVRIFVIRIHCQTLYLIHRAILFHLHFIQLSLLSIRFRALMFFYGRRIEIVDSANQVFFQSSTSVVKFSKNGMHTNFQETKMKNILRKILYDLFFSILFLAPK